MRLAGLLGCVLVSGVMGTGLVAAPAAVAMGPCAGPSITSFSVAARLVGKGSHESPKVVLGVQTDAVGRSAGNLIVERGSERIIVKRWCRVWRSQKPDGVVHALGDYVAPDGTQRSVRIDLRSGSPGALRVMTRRQAVDSHDAAGLASGEAEHGWASLFGSGWTSVTQVRVGDSRRSVGLGRTIR